MPYRVGESSEAYPSKPGDWKNDGEGTLRTRGLYGVCRGALFGQQVPESYPGYNNGNLCGFCAFPSRNGVPSQSRAFCSILCSLPSSNGANSPGRYFSLLSAPSSASQKLRPMALSGLDIASPVFRSKRRASSQSVCQGEGQEIDRQQFRMQMSVGLNNKVMAMANILAVLRNREVKRNRLMAMANMSVTLASTKEMGNTRLELPTYQSY
jgi:hypothetical protein